MKHISKEFPGVKALDEAGEVIEKGKLIGGKRPAHYLIDGEKISAKDFKKAFNQLSSEFEKELNKVVKNKQK